MIGVVAAGVAAAGIAISRTQKSVERTWRAVQFPPRPRGVVANMNDEAFREVALNHVAARKAVAEGSDSPESRALAKVKPGSLYAREPFAYSLPELSGLASVSGVETFPYVNLTEFGIYVVELKIGQLTALQAVEGFSDDDLVSRAFDELWLVGKPVSLPAGLDLSGYDMPGFADFRYSAESSIRTIFELMSPSKRFATDFPVVPPKPASGTVEPTVVADGMLVGFPLEGFGSILDFSRLDPLQSNVEGGITWLSIRPVALSSAAPDTSVGPVLVGRINQSLVYGVHDVVLHEYRPETGSQDVSFSINHHKLKQ